MVETTILKHRPKALTLEEVLAAGPGKVYRLAERDSAYVITARHANQIILIDITNWNPIPYQLSYQFHPVHTAKLTIQDYT